MPAKPLTDEQKQDAGRLRSIFKSRQLNNDALTQESLAYDCGWKTQGAVQQYLNGRIPLNIPALVKFSKALSVTPMDISPILAMEMQKIASAVTAAIRIPAHPPTYHASQEARSEFGNDNTITEVIKLITMYKKLSSDDREYLMTVVESLVSASQFDGSIITNY